MGVTLVGVGRGHTLSPEAAASWKRMARAGMPTGGLTSSTRSLARQWDLYNNRGKPGWPKYAAHPLESKHVWRPDDKKDRGGRAVDVNEPTRSWLVKNGAAHGWRRPFVAVEPWHFEYNITKDKHLEDDMPLTRADADLVVDRLLARRIEHTEGQKAATGRTKPYTVERMLTDAGAGGFRAWKDLPALRAELAATRAALVALAKNTGLDAASTERIIRTAVDKALSDISITLTSGD